ncbi:MAG: hypothetical protein BGO70_02275 [Bacteroidetes bacterium 43-93]|mgnify:CR=1 FL=1|nr:hypothetical protein [Bacteroidota bacterium]OJW99123.1 MAG: hypothetical protein BGO70_02275 [Bacteroidetes bacterium 43-93]
MAGNILSKILLEGNWSNKSIQIGDVLSDGSHVFYVDGTGQHGLSCNPYVVNPGGGFNVIWGCSTNTTGANADGVGMGLNNMNIVRGLCGTGTFQQYAFNISASAISDGYYLPSKTELSLLVSNLIVPKIYNPANYVSTFSSTFWSSTEVDGPNAWAVDTLGNVAKMPKTTGFAIVIVKKF